MFKGREPTDMRSLVIPALIYTNKNLGGIDLFIDL